MIILQVFSFGWLAMVIKEIATIDLFGDGKKHIEDIEKLTNTHAYFCKMFIIMYGIKVYVWPQFTYLISTALAKSNLSDNTEETIEVVVENSKDTIKRCPRSQHDINCQ